MAHERSRGECSQWFGYLNTLPEHEPLPLLWPEAELKRLLVGTGLVEMARERRRELAAEHRYMQTVLRSLGELDIAEALPLDAYLAAASLTSSRAFYVDAWHEEGLVPFADLLNHKCASPF